MENFDVRFSKLDEDGYYDFYKFDGIDKYINDGKVVRWIIILRK